MNGRIVWRTLVCVALTAVLVATGTYIVPVNSTTAALAMLLLVLGIATRWGLGEAVFTSVVCVFAFNFYFLPPIGTLTIADPQNWVALTAFLISAMVASQLSAKAKKRAEEALRRRIEVERLYQLSRAMLLDEVADLTRSALTPIAEIFGLHEVAFLRLEDSSILPVQAGSISKDLLESTAVSGEPRRIGEVSYLPVRLGARVVGSLGLAGPALSDREGESIAALVAIGYERIQALRRAAEAEAAREGERLKTSVLDGIAHDLKTPLTAIKSCVTTLITIAPQSEESRGELLAIIDEETERLHRRITEAIQLARVESSKVTLQKTSVSVGASLRSMLDKHDAAERVALHVAPHIRILADPQLFEQAIWQLVENALKYSHSEVEIEAEEDRDITIRVCDRGPGIPPREIERIFDKFYRGSRTSRDAKGSGLGLAIARGIIEAHGGRIWAENRPGGGSVFVVQLSGA